MKITITEAINLLKQYYKAHNREDVEIEGEIRVIGGEVVVSAKPEIKDQRSRVGVKFTPEQEKQIRSLSADKPMDNKE